MVDSLFRRFCPNLVSLLLGCVPLKLIKLFHRQVLITKARKLRGSLPQIACTTCDDQVGIIIRAAFCERNHVVDRCEVVSIVLLTPISNPDKLSAIMAVKRLFLTLEKRTITLHLGPALSILGSVIPLQWKRLHGVDSCCRWLSSAVSHLCVYL